MFKKSISMLLVLACSLFIAGFSYANTPQPGPAVISVFSPAGTAIPKGVFALATDYIHAEKDRVWVNGSDYKAKNESTFNLFALKPRYGFGNGWDLRVLIPFIANDFSKVPSRNGLGDSIAILRKQIFDQNAGYPVSFGAGLGVVLPTGSTSYDGLGTGAWGLLGEIGITYAFNGGRQVLEFGINYTWKGDGDAEGPDRVKIDDIDQNDKICAYARYAIAINKNWDFGIEAQYENIFESERHGRGRDDSSSSLFAGPSLRFKMPQWNASLGISPQFALYNDYEAAHRSGVGPAAERFRLEMNFMKVF